MCCILINVIKITHISCPTRGSWNPQFWYNPHWSSLLYTKFVWSTLSVRKEDLKEVFPLYNYHGHTLSQEPAPRVIKFSIFVDCPYLIITIYSICLISVQDLSSSADWVTLLNKLFLSSSWDWVTLLTKLSPSSNWDWVTKLSLSSSWDLVTLLTKLSLSSSWDWVTLLTKLSLSSSWDWVTLLTKLSLSSS